MESVSECSSDLDANGITNFRVEDAPAGKWIDSPDEVVLRRNPYPPVSDDPDDEPRDERCETAPRRDTRPDGADPFDLVTEEPPYWTAENPDDGSFISIPLHYGNPYSTSGQARWGFRHIFYKHGWDETVATNTSNALLRFPSANGGQSGRRRESDGRLTYWYQFVHPQTAQLCTQIVWAREQPKPGDEETLGILTSYASYGWNVPPPT